MLNENPNDPHGGWPDSQSENLNSKEMIAWADKHEMVCVYPKPNQLQIDIDDAAQYTRFRRSMDIFWGQKEVPFRIVSWKELPSKTGDDIHKHIIVELEKPVSDIARILLQAVFGSDSTRELLSYCRFLQNDPHPTMLVRPKEEKIA